MNWNDLKNRIRARGLTSATWASDQESLIRIFDKAQEWGIDPMDASAASLSNLRSAVSECKRAIRWGQKEALEEIFCKARALPNVEFRLALHIPDLEDVIVQPERGEYLIRASRSQYERMRQSTRLQLRFQERTPVSDYEAEYQ